MQIDTTTHVTVQGNNSAAEQIDVRHEAPVRGISANSVHTR